MFAPNVRGSGGYGRSFAAADDHARRFVAITDVRAAVTYLVEAALADPARVGVAGRSYGGYLTLAALARFPELFAVGVDVCGISDFATFYAETEPWIAAAATTKYGDPTTDADLLRALSPIHQADRITAPLLVVHGAYDTNVPLVEAEQIVDALRDRAPPPASCCSTTRATRCTGWTTGRGSCARWSRGWRATCRTRWSRRPEGGRRSGRQWEKLSITVAPFVPVLITKR